MSRIKELLIVTDEDANTVLQRYNKTKEEIKHDVAILKEWLRQEVHLPEDEDDERLERFYLRNKCRIEQTKQKLDNCYSFKILYPDYFAYLNPCSEIIQSVRKYLVFLPLPKLTKDNGRIMFFKIINSDIVKGFEMVQYCLLMWELCVTYDYSIGDHFIADWSGFTFNAMKTLEPSLLHKYITIQQEVLSGRFFNIIYFNVPPFVEVFLELMKTVLKPKIFGKIKCYKKIEGVYDVIPKEYLPAEYGGNQKSYMELHEEWGKELELQKDVLAKIAARKSDEAVRIGKLKNTDMFGTEGTFRKINLD